MKRMTRKSLIIKFGFVQVSVSPISRFLSRSIGIRWNVFFLPICFRMSEKCSDFRIRVFVLHPKTKELPHTLNDLPTQLIFLNPGLSQPLFGFIFLFLGTLLVEIDNFHDGKWWSETGKEKEEYAPLYHTLLEKAWHPVRIDWQQFLTEKSQSPTRDLNPACPDRMPSLYHLCRHHHFHYLTTQLIQYLSRVN